VLDRCHLHGRRPGSGPDRNRSAARDGPAEVGRVPGTARRAEGAAATLSPVPALHALAAYERSPAGGAPGGGGR